MLLRGQTSRLTTTPCIQGSPAVHVPPAHHAACPMLRIAELMCCHAAASAESRSTSVSESLATVAGRRMCMNASPIDSQLEAQISVLACNVCTDLFLYMRVGKYT